MFKIKSDELKKMVNEVCSAYKHSKVDATVIEVSTNKEEGILKFVSSGPNMTFEKKVPIQIDQEDILFTTTPYELQLKVGTLPNEVYINIAPTPKGHYHLRWGRDNGILLLTSEAKVQHNLLDLEIDASISMEASKWNFFTRNIMPFTSLPGDNVAKIHPITVGVNFEKKDNGIIVQATNGVRAIKGTFSLDWFAKGSTIPANVMNVVTSLISSQEILTISMDKEQNFIVVESPTAKVVAKLLDGNFIPTDSLYCDEFADIVWRADRLELIEVARRIKRLSPEKPVVKILTKDTKQFATLEGVLVEQIGAVIESESKNGFILNANSLEAALTVMRCEEILLTCAEPSAPVTILNGDPVEEDSKKNKDDLKVMLSQI